VSSPNDPNEDLFGQEIFRYTRQNAIRDGVLLDITETVRTRATVKLPAVITIALWEALAGAEPFRPDHPAVDDLCDGVAFAAAGLVSSEWSDCDDGGILVFGFTSGARKFSVKLVRGPSDEGLPVMTIMLPDET
jgi:hypothetical protein